MSDNNAFARHQTLVAILRSFRGFAKLRSIPARSRDSIRVVEFHSGPSAEDQAAAEAKAGIIVAQLRAHGIAVDWNGSWTTCITVIINRGAAPIFAPVNYVPAQAYWPMVEMANAKRIGTQHDSAWNDYDVKPTANALAFKGEDKLVLFTDESKSARIVDMAV